MYKKEVPSCLYRYYHQSTYITCFLQVLILVLYNIAYANQGRSQDFQKGFLYSRARSARAKFLRTRPLTVAVSI